MFFAINIGFFKYLYIISIIWHFCRNLSKVYDLIQLSETTNRRMSPFLYMNISNCWNESDPTSVVKNTTPLKFARLGGLTTRVQSRVEREKDSSSKTTTRLLLNKVSSDNEGSILRNNYYCPGASLRRIEIGYTQRQDSFHKQTRVLMSNSSLYLFRYINRL